MAKEVNYAFENCDCYCDRLGCKREELVDDTDFSGINSELRNMGWITTKINNEWLDFCSKACLEKYKETHK